MAEPLPKSPHDYASGNLGSVGIICAIAALKRFQNRDSPRESNAAAINPNYIADVVNARGTTWNIQAGKNYIRDKQSYLLEPQKRRVPTAALRLRLFCVASSAPAEMTAHYCWK
jgi:hypothetical protein